MILTVTLNPAIDKVVVINNFTLHKLHRLKASEFNLTLPGGKGVNIALALKLFKNDVVATGFAAGHSGHLLCDELRAKGLTTNFIFCNGKTRTNISILDLEKETLTEINEPGPIAEKMDETFFLETYKRLLYRVKMVVIAGSMPKDMQPDFYASLIRYAKQKNIPVVIHTSPKNFDPAIKESPFAIIPDLRSVVEYRGRKVNNINDLVQIGKEILRDAAESEHVILINRIENVVAVNRKNAYILRPSNLKIINMLGYADSFVAGFVHGIYHRDSLPKTLQFASACGLTNVEQVCKDLKFLDTIYENVSRIQIEEIL